MKVERADIDAVRAKLASLKGRKTDQKKISSFCNETIFD